MNPPILEPGPSDPSKKEINPLLKLALELGPLMVFFFANARGAWLSEKFPALADLGAPIFIATGAVHGRDGRSRSRCHGCSPARCRSCRWSRGIVVLVFGGLTLYLQNDIFIKMKPTIINTLFGAVLLGGLCVRQIAARLCLRFRPSASTARAGGS